MKYTHLIITKVNVKWREQSKDPVWLGNRIKIINNILRPSLQAQTNKNFKFITLWGYEPEGGIENEHQIFIKSEGAAGILKELNKKILNYIDEENVLVTRIDSDNALGENFVETLQSNLIETTPFYYDIKSMHMLNTKTGGKSIWKPDKTSGFISVMERTLDFQCIPYKYSHGDIGKYVKGVSLDLDVLLTIHGDNLCVKSELGERNNFDLSKYNLK